jgi:hypothetical protein
LGIGDWFRKGRRDLGPPSGSKRPGAVAVDPRTAPEEVRKYLAAVEKHKAHPFVRQYYRQVAWLSVGASADQLHDLYLIEFRDQLNTAFVWQAPDGNWGAGPWIRVAHIGADATCPPSEFLLKYFMGAHANPEFTGAVSVLEASRPH